MRYSVIIFSILFTALSGPVSSSDLSFAKDQFIKGAEAYKAGEYELALEHFKQADSTSTGFAVNYNLGNAHFKLNNIKESILYYERALKYEPSNEDVIYNLRLANDLIVDQIENLPKSKLNRWWRNFRYGMGPDGWAKISILFAFASAILFLLYSLRWNSGLRRLGFYGSILTFALMICSISLAQSAMNFQEKTVSGVIFADKVDVKSEPRAESIDILVLHAGTKVQILEEQDGWFEVQIASGDRGWLSTDLIEEI